MFRLPFNTNFWLFFFLFFAPAITVTAQETHLYNQLLKESLRPDFMRPDISLEMDSSVGNSHLLKESLKPNSIKPDISLEMDSSVSNIQKLNDIDKESVYRMLFHYRIEGLMPEKNIVHFEDQVPRLSTSATQFFYTNSKNESWDSRKFNGDGSFSGVFATKKDELESKAVRVMVPIPAILFLIVSVAEKTGIIPADSINAQKESEEAKTLKIIKKDVYHIED